MICPGTIIHHCFNNSLLRSDRPEPRVVDGPTPYLGCTRLYVWFVCRLNQPRRLLRQSVICMMRASKQPTYILPGCYCYYCLWKRTTMEVQLVLPEAQNHVTDQIIYGRPFRPQWQYPHEFRRRILGRLSAGERTTPHSSSFLTFAIV